MAYDKVIDSAQLEANLTSIADKIREKADITDKLEFPSGFLNAFDYFPGVNDVETQMMERNITENGQYFILPDEEYYAIGMLSVKVNVPIPEYETWQGGSF